MKKTIVLIIICMMLFTTINFAFALETTHSGAITVTNNQSEKIIETDDGNIEIYRSNPSIKGSSNYGPDLQFIRFKAGWGYRLTNQHKSNVLIIGWLVENVGNSYSNNGKEIDDYWVYFYINDDSEPIFTLNQRNFLTPTEWAQGTEIGGGRYFHLPEKPNSVRVVADFNNAIPETNEDNNEATMTNIPDCAILKGNVYKKVNGELKPEKDAHIDSTVIYFADELGHYEAMIIPKKPYDEKNTYEINVYSGEKILKKTTEPVKAGQTTTLNYIVSEIPNKPKNPTGETVLKVGVQYSYKTSSTDPDNDKLYYKWSWGDGESTDWLGPYKSGEVCEASHKWDKMRAYVVEVRVKDEGGLMCLDDGQLVVTLPRSTSRFLIFDFLQEFLNKFFPTILV